MDRCTVRNSALLLLALSACAAGDGPSILDPASDAARRVEQMWWSLFWVSAVVVVVVTAFILVAASKRSQHTADVDQRPVRWGEPFVVIAGLVVTGIILAGSFLLSLREMHVLASPPTPTQLSIEVTARNWWWDVRYPNGAVTANEIHVPVGVPVELVLLSADVIHSFWVPQLQLKKDHVPGMENTLWLLADEPGRYRGQCAEFCGLQHAKMAVYVVAQPRAEFDAWVENAAAPAPEPASVEAARGQDVFLSSSCIGCHTIRGTSAVGDLGPDLTHLLSRETIGAGTLPLTRRTLRGFVEDPHDAKPGVTMPPAELSSEELDAVVDYLMQLE